MRDTCIYTRMHIHVKGLREFQPSKSFILAMGLMCNCDWIVIYTVSNNYLFLCFIIFKSLKCYIFYTCLKSKCTAYCSWSNVYGDFLYGATSCWNSRNFSLFSIYSIMVQTNRANILLLEIQSFWMRIIHVLINAPSHFRDL